jgi:hypothetical protein
MLVEGIWGKFILTFADEDRWSCIFRRNPYVKESRSWCRLRGGDIRTGNLLWVGVDCSESLSAFIERFCKCWWMDSDLTHLSCGRFLEMHPGYFVRCIRVERCVCVISLFDCVNVCVRVCVCVCWGQIWGRIGFDSFSWCLKICSCRSLPEGFVADLSVCMAVITEHRRTSTLNLKVIVRVTTGPHSVQGAPSLARPESGQFELRTCCYNAAAASAAGASNLRIAWRSSWARPGPDQTHTRGPMPLGRGQDTISWPFLLQCPSWLGVIVAHRFASASASTAIRLDGLLSNIQFIIISDDGDIFLLFRLFPTFP